MILDETGRDPGDSASDAPQRQPSADAPPESQSEFDPRFDPAFQRGYQPTPGERARTRVRSQADTEAPFRRPSTDRPDAPPSSRTPPALSPASPDLREHAVEATGVLPSASDVDDLGALRSRFAPDDVNVPFGDTDTDVAGSSYAASPSAAYSYSMPPGAVAPRASVLDGLDVSPRRNPWFLALWLIGCGFVVLGIVLYVVSVFTSYTSSPTASQDVSTLVFSQVGWMLAGPLITVGLATVVALIILSALTAKRGPRAGASEASTGQ